MQESTKRIAVLGASGAIGRRIVARLLERGFDTVCQTRSAEKLSQFAGRVAIHAFDPKDGEGLKKFLRGAKTVIYALGTSRMGATTLFSDTTKALIEAMKQEEVRRLIAITGVGAGETKGHGGPLYNWFFYPLFTHRIYADKNRQERLIEASGLDWIIVRPAPFFERTRRGPVDILTQIKPETQLAWISRDEVADFVVAQVGSGRYLRQKLFIGHA
jgi:putative NADH-flavin reductase